jgi:hypothetical protein
MVTYRIAWERMAAYCHAAGARVILGSRRTRNATQAGGCAGAAARRARDRGCPLVIGCLPGPTKQKSTDGGAGHALGEDEREADGSLNQSQSKADGAHATADWRPRSDLSGPSGLHRRCASWPPLRGHLREHVRQPPLVLVDHGLHGRPDEGIPTNGRVATLGQARAEWMRSWMGLREAARELGTPQRLRAFNGCTTSVLDDAHEQNPAPSSGVLCAMSRLIRLSGIRPNCSGGNPTKCRGFHGRGGDLQGRLPALAEWGHHPAPRCSRH